MSEYLQTVLRGHPIVQQSELLDELGAQTIREALGAIDPKLEGDFARKSFDNKTYWNETYAKLKVPTWLGIDLEAGYEHNTGDFLDESETLPTAGLWNIGIHIPLGNGLLYDRRRAELDKAKVYDSAQEQERLIMINDLLYDALYDYCHWQLEYALNSVYQRAVIRAQNRYENTVASYEVGDKAAIDTLEAYIALQQRQNDLTASNNNMAVAKIIVESYIWDQGSIPMELDAGIAPESIRSSDISLTKVLINLNAEQSIADNPLLTVLSFQLNQLDIDRRLIQEFLKPTVDLQFNPLLYGNDSRRFGYEVDNYKFGASVAIPLRQRKTRAKMEKTELKRQDIALKLSNKRREILNKANILYRDQAMLEEQLLRQNNMVSNYGQLLNAEEDMFSIGESSIFLLNNRDLKYLDSQIKENEMRNKLLTNRLKILQNSFSLLSLQS